MDRFKITGGGPLKGEVTVNGSKNAALPVLVASLLTDEPFEVSRLPLLRDIRTTFRILEALGKKIDYENDRAVITSAGQLSTSAPYDLVKQMRASNLVAGPLVARFKHARVPLPGGCAIGLRPMDIHLSAFEKLGATVATEQGDIVLTAKKLRGAHIKFPFPSVGATENIMMCAALVPGTTVIENPALEPEIADLALCLNEMGADVKLSHKTITITGKEAMHGAKHRVTADRIEAGTYLIAVASGGGRAKIRGCVPGDLKALLSALEKSGAKISVNGDCIEITGPARPKPVSITTKPHPGFPTDLQAPWMAYMCRAKGLCRIRETIFENRFMHAAELARMGANILVKGNTAYIRGVERLSGAIVMSSDLRGGAALALAALSANGGTEIQRVYHIDRGYFRLEEGLRGLGAKMLREHIKE
jgi:UDP-N-acetylglucosamine 1-carboxyvinyltransferase